MIAGEREFGAGMDITIEHTMVDGIIKDVHGKLKIVVSSIPVETILDS
jgi:hypothetical protein